MQSLRHQIAFLHNGVLLLSFHQAQTVDRNAQMRSETFVKLVSLRQQSGVQMEIQQEKAEILRTTADMKEIGGTELLFGLHAQLRKKIFRHPGGDAQRQIASQTFLNPFERQGVQRKPGKCLGGQVHARREFNETALTINQKNGASLRRRVLHETSRKALAHFIDGVLLRNKARHLVEVREIAVFFLYRFGFLLYLGRQIFDQVLQTACHGVEVGSNGFEFAGTYQMQSRIKLAFTHGRKPRSNVFGRANHPTHQEVHDPEQTADGKNHQKRLNALLDHQSLVSVYGNLLVDGIDLRDKALKLIGTDRVGLFAGKQEERSHDIAPFV